MIPSAPPVPPVPPVVEKEKSGNDKESTEKVSFIRAPLIPPMMTDASPFEVKITNPEPVEIPVYEEEVQGELPPGHKEVLAVFFFPKDAERNLESVHRKFLGSTISRAEPNWMNRPEAQAADPREETTV